MWLAGFVGLEQTTEKEKAQRLLQKAQQNPSNQWFINSVTQRQLRNIVPPLALC